MLDLFNIDEVYDVAKDDVFNDIVFDFEVNKNYRKFSLVKNENEELILTDNKGNKYLVRTYTYFVNGISKIYLLDESKYIFMNMEGEVSPKFDYAGKFCGRFVPVKMGEEYGFMDYNFKLHHFDKGYTYSNMEFKNNFIIVGKGDKKMFLDKHLNPYMRKYRVKEMLEKDVNNFKYIPVMYFDNSSAIEEFLQQCNNKLIRDNVSYEQRVEFLKEAGLLKEMRENALKQNKVLDKKYSKYISACMFKNQEFKSQEENTF